jgi:hypothetical protein
MILTFQPGLKHQTDTSDIAKKFYLALTLEYVPERRLTKQEFVDILEPESDLKRWAQATNFETISRNGERVLITFYGVKISIEEDDLIGVKVVKDEPLGEFDKKVDDDDDLIGIPVKLQRKESISKGTKEVTIGTTVGWWMSKGERIEGVISKKSKGHGKDYYGIVHEGKVKWKLVDKVNIL